MVRQRDFCQHRKDAKIEHHVMYDMFDDRNVPKRWKVRICRFCHSCIHKIAKRRNDITIRTPYYPKSPSKLNLDKMRRHARRFIIPGIYCYIYKDDKKNWCPFWYSIRGEPEYFGGVCCYTAKQNSFSFCKQCGVKHYGEPYKYETEGWEGLNWKPKDWLKEAQDTDKQGETEGSGVNLLSVIQQAEVWAEQLKAENEAANTPWLIIDYGAKKLQEVSLGEK